ncbi:D-alanyl-D-alanine carboxypeptidase [Streptomyces sp. NPDC051445]|uniref:D-alanyl-D-alanine carboxypeptidase n=1 Tax=Streptomyces sp. NPDC051445 TaxID=3365653 RepID=UPI0037AF58D0
MAGESPDRSKQRESSAEPTSGSGGTVPEARESRDVRDPRVAVARDAEPSAARGGVDTATRVFSVRDLKTTESGNPTESDEPAEGGKPVGAGKQAEPAETESAAESTGTAAAGAPTETGAAEEGTATDEAAEPAEDETGAGAAGSGAAGSGTAGAGSGAAEDTAEDAGSVADDESAAETAQDGPEGTETAESASGTAEGASGGGDERLREAVAQWVASADDKGSAKAPAADSTADGSPSDEEPADAEPSDGEPAAEAPAAEATADAKSADVEPEDAKPSGGAPADAEPSDRAPEDAEPSDEDTEVEAEERSASEAAGTEDDGTEDAGPEDAPASAPAAGSAAKPAPKWASNTDEPKADDEAPDGGTGKAAAAAADSDGDKPGRSPVDQPTAVFKTPRPKPAVDQPTTMLKLGGATKPEKAEAKADEKAGAGTAAEADPAERTSKFVALKPLDEPRPHKPAADVTALVPQVGPERTTQQPLPPKPPLDLLAELTNTPPPPPTPLRTLGRRLKIWTPLVLLLLTVFAIAQSVRPLPATALTLTAKDSYTFEGGRTQLPWPGEGQGWIDADGVGTMGDFGKQTPVAIGSVAKTMTAYIILKDHPMKAGEEGPKIAVDATAEKEGGYDVTGDESTLNTVKAGDQLTEHQALSAVLIPSANNIARLLARWDAGSEAAFVKKMNATAKELGMTNTTYTDPSGLKETTVSTAEDQVKLGRAFVKVPALVAISSAASWDDPSGKNWPNYNTLPFNMGAIGIKTGSTTAAGGNLLFASRKKVGGQTVTLVGAILGQHKPRILETVNAVSQTALLAAQEALASAKIMKKGDVVGYVDDKLGGHTPVVITEDVSAVGWAGMTVKLSFTAGEVPHTAKAGTQVGTLTVGDGSISAVKVPVALQSDLAEPGFSDKLTRIG